MNLIGIIFLVVCFLSGGMQAADIASIVSHAQRGVQSMGLPELPSVQNFVTPGALQTVDGYNNTEVTIYPVYHQARSQWPAEEIEILECTGSSCGTKKLSLEKIQKSADGTNCGYHALKNAYCFLMAYQMGDPAWLQRMQEIPFFLNLLKPWLRFTLPYRSLGAAAYAFHPLGNWPSSDELNRLLGVYENTSLENQLQKKMGISQYVALQNQALDYVFKLMEQNIMPSEYITVVDKLAIFGYDASADVLITEHAVEILKKIQKRFMIQKRAVHAFIVNTSAADTHGESGVHWITMVMYKEDKKVKWAFTSSLPNYTEIIPQVQKTFDFLTVNVRNIKQRSLVASNADVIARFEQQVDDFYHANLSLIDRIRSLFGYKKSRFEERKVLLQSILQKLYHSTFIDAMQVSEYKEKISSIIRGLLYFLDENQKVYFAELYDMSLDEKKQDLKTMPAILEKMYNDYRAVDAHIFSQMDATLQSLGLVQDSSGEEVYEQGGPIDFGEDDLHL